jgi:serine/threonine-protein kinase
MAPEQLEGRLREIGAATDVFSLGVIFYELLAGRPPFGSGGRLDVLQRVLSDDPPPLSTLVPHVPNRLETICRACLSKRPRDRIATAEQLRIELSR